MKVGVKLFRGRSSLIHFFTENLLANPQRMILLSFLSVIMIGAVMLMLPGATYAEGSIGVIDALFTATSATCVTGLSTVDVPETFTIFGQITIMTLIQIGGLGIMTFSTFFMFFFVGKLSITGKDTFIDTFSQNPIVELGRLIRTVFIFTFMVEITGGLLLTERFLMEYSLGDAFYYGLFHSISSFCNAGFSVLDNGYMDYGTDWYFSGVNILLIICGGLGFIVIYDINVQMKHLWKGFFRRLSLHTRIVIITTLLLLFTGALFFYVLEFGNTLKGFSWHSQLILSVFQSATTRTAGFNTVQIDTLLPGTLYFIIILMFVGASPGSCGGGIKTTTFVIFIQSLVKQFSNNKDINICQRRIPQETLNRAASIVFFGIFTVGLFVLLLLLSEIHFGENRDKFSLMDILFEVVSAFGTVGLSTGVTRELSEAGKILVTILMYIGRLGPLTLVFALKSSQLSNLRYMKEDILVG